MSSYETLGLAMKLYMCKVLHNRYQGHVTFSMTSLYFNTLIEVKHFYEQIKFLIFDEISL